MSSPEVRGTLDVGEKRVSVAWVQPGEPAPVLVVAHGAGAGMDHPFLAGFCRALVTHGIGTMRFNFQYVEAGRRAPDSEVVLRHTWLAAFEAATARAEGRAVLAGGKSLGGRIASMCIADGMPAAGLVCLGYPLHPPGRPERIRDEHLYRIRVPMLFLQGTADPFARPDLLEPVLAKLGDLATHVRVEGGDHSFNVKGSRQDAREVGASLAGLAAPFILRVAGRAR